MSKIKITEVDLTTVEPNQNEGNDVVYIPGFSSLNSTSGEAAEPGVPTLCRTLYEFNKYFGPTPAVFTSDQAYPAAFDDLAKPSLGAPMFSAEDPDPSYVYAKELIASGVPVIYERVNTNADDVTVAAMYNFLSMNYSQSNDCDGISSVDSSSVLVVADTFTSAYDNRYLAEGSYVFTAKSDVEGTITSTSPQDLDTTITVDGAKFTSKIIDGEEIFKLPGTYNFTTVFNLYANSLATNSHTAQVGWSNMNAFLTYDSGKYAYTGNHVFTYTSSTWKDSNNDTVTLSDLGISITGTPSNNDKIFATVSKNDNQTQTTVSGLESLFLTTSFLTSCGIALSGSIPMSVQFTVVVSPITDYNTDADIWYDSSDNNVLLNALGVTLITSTAPVYGDTITIDHFVAEPDLIDKDTYNLKYITSGGYPTFEYNSNNVSQAMATLAANRGDAVALIDHTNKPERLLIGTSSVYSRANSAENKLGVIDGIDTAQYAAMFTPYCTYSVSQNYGTVNVTNCQLPASFAYLKCLATSIATNPSWLAIAGATRGKVTNLVSVNTSKAITNSIADSYQTDTDVCINPITNIRPYGQCIWGNRTLKDNSVKRTTSATSYLNIRNMACDIKKQLYIACQSLLFEQNTDILWINFLSLVTPLLDRMVSGYGISNYKIIKENPSDKTKITATVRIYPIYAVEAFDITLYLQNGEVAVEE